MNDFVQTNGSRDIREILESMRSHARALEEDGFGDVSPMCYRSIWRTENENPQLPEIYADARRKFVSMAHRITPPEFVAEFIRGLFEEGLIPSQVDPDKLDKHLQKLIARTAGGKEDLSLVSDYLRFLATDPHLLLACGYLATAMFGFTVELANAIENKSIAMEVVTFGAHFQVSNITSVLPFELYKSLRRLHGPHVRSDMVDCHVLRETLENMHQSEAFILTRHDGEVAPEQKGFALRCPMDSYLDTFLGKHDVLQSIIAAGMRGIKILEDGEFLVIRNQFHAEALFMYVQNMLTVQEVVGGYLIALASGDFMESIFRDSSVSPVADPA